MKKDRTMLTYLTNIFNLVTVLMIVFKSKNEYYYLQLQIMLQNVIQIHTCIKSFVNNILLQKTYGNDMLQWYVKCQMFVSSCDEFVIITPRTNFIKNAIIFQSTYFVQKMTIKALRSNGICNFAKHR